MPQLAYPQNMPVAFAGMKADSGDDRVDSAAAIECMLFGVLGVYDRAANRIALPRPNVVVITEDAGTFTAGNITTVVNGVTVTTAWGVSKAATMTQHAVDIQALAFVLTAVSAAPNLTVTAIPGVGLWQCAMDFTQVTGTMAAATYVNQVTDQTAGFALAEAKEYGSARRAWNDRAVCTLAGDVLNAGDLINAAVNGVAMGTVTYAVSEANTLQLIANALQAIPGVLTAIVDAVLRTITITMNPGLELVVTGLIVTDAVLAAVAPTFTVVYSQQADPVAVSETAYLPTETVSHMRRGRAYMRAEEAIAFGDPVFVRAAVRAGFPLRGSFRNDVDAGTCFAFPALRFAGPSVAAPDGTLVVPVEINLP